MELKYAFNYMLSGTIMCDGVSPTKTLRFHLNEDLGSFDISHHAQPDTFHFPLIVIMGSSSF